MDGVGGWGLGSELRVRADWVRRLSATVGEFVAFSPILTVASLNKLTVALLGDESPVISGSRDFSFTAALLERCASRKASTLIFFAFFGATNSARLGLRSSFVDTLRTLLALPSLPLWRLVGVAIIGFSCCRTCKSLRSAPADWSSGNLYGKVFWEYSISSDLFCFRCEVRASFFPSFPLVVPFVARIARAFARKSPATVRFGNAGSSNSDAMDSCFEFRERLMKVLWVVYWR